jgi:membrane-bound lytic murein transglycosylase D
MLKFLIIVFCSFAHDLEPPLFFEDPQAITKDNEDPGAEADVVEAPKDEDSDSESETAVEATKPHEVGSKRPWAPPNYSQQEAHLGYQAQDFEATPALRDRVNFWIDIYTKYTTDEGVLHDSLHVKVVYAAIDFRPIMNDSNIKERDRRRARKKLVEDKKLEIKERLTRLSRLNSSEGLSGEDLRYWKMFESFDEPNKFKEALGRKRLRFQLGQRDRFIQGIFYSGRYLTEMERIFKEAGMPLQLTRLPFVESSFNVKARSHVGASGIWQFMRYTGKKFMRLTPGSDERNDPLTATKSAARLMAMNYKILKKWPLAITAYNHGAGGVSRMVKKFGTDDISALVDERHRRFGFASASFYASFLAAVEVEKDAKKYFGDVYWDAPISSKSLQIIRPVGRHQVIEWFGGDEELAKEFNPHLTRNFWRGYARIYPKDFVRLPENKLETAQKHMEKLPNTPAPLNVGETYMVSSGENLWDISRNLGVSMNAMIEINGLDNPRQIRPGQKLLIPKKN